MDIFVAVLAWLIADLQAAAIVVSLLAVGQHVVASLVICQSPLLTAYIIWLDTNTRSTTQVVNYTTAAALITNSTYC